jgi:hypothetical protein
VLHFGITVETAHSAARFVSKMHSQNFHMLVGMIFPELDGAYATL